MRHSKKLDFFFSEFYMSYVKVFLADSKLGSQIRKECKNIKVIKRYDDLKKIDQPCFYLNAENGKIEQFNKEAMKFLRLRKY